MITYLYFFEAPGRIKIGISRKVLARLREVGKHMDAPPRLIGYIEGSYGLERFLHQKLEAHRLRAEWFSDHPVVRQTIEALMAEGPSAVGYVESERVDKQSARLKLQAAPDAIPRLLRLMWPDDAIAEMQSLTGEPEAVVRAWLANPNSIPDVVRLAIAALVVMYMTGDSVPSFRDRPNRSEATEVNG